MAGSKIKSIEQERAKAAYDFVRQVKTGDLKDILKDIKFGKAVFTKEEWDKFLSNSDREEIIRCLEKEETSEAEKIKISIDKISDETKKGLGSETFSEILQHTKKLRKIKNDYKSGVKKFPVRIKTNGLGQTLAFIKNRNDGYDLLYKQIAIWLQQDMENPVLNKGELIKELISKNITSQDYRQITREVLAFSIWLRRFVDGLMEDVEEEI